MRVVPGSMPGVRSCARDMKWIKCAAQISMVTMQLSNNAMCKHQIHFHCNATHFYCNAPPLQCTALPLQCKATATLLQQSHARCPSPRRPVFVHSRRNTACATTLPITKSMCSVTHAELCKQILRRTLHCMHSAPGHPVSLMPLCSRCVAVKRRPEHALRTERANGIYVFRCLGGMSGSAT